MSGARPGCAVRDPQPKRFDRGQAHRAVQRLVVGALVATAAVVVGVGAALPSGASTGAPTAYVVNTFDNTVSVIDTATQTVEDTIVVGNTPEYVAVTPDGAKAYVSNFSDDTVSVIDTATNSVIAVISVGAEPVGIGITPDGTKAYVVDLGQNTVSVIDTATETVTGHDSGGQRARGRGHRARRDRGLHDEPVRRHGQRDRHRPPAPSFATVPVGPDPLGVAISPDGTATSSSPIKATTQ